MFTAIDWSPYRLEHPPANLSSSFIMSAVQDADLGITTVAKMRAFVDQLKDVHD